MKWIVINTSIILSLAATIAYADNESATALAKKAQNPVESMISVPFDNNWNGNFGPLDRTQYILNMKPVIPFAINDCWNLITRTIIPIIRQPNLVNTHNYINGIGDINPTFFISPNSTGDFKWGVGPMLILPTASNTQLGQGKYSVGPSAVILITPGHWVVGVLASNAWSVGGDSNRDAVNQFTMQYFINYNLADGWYLTTSPIITADWYANSTNRWTVPVGFGVGRVLRIASQAINISMQAYDNVKSPTIGPDWQAQFNISFLFPS